MGESIEERLHPVWMLAFFYFVLQGRKCKRVLLRCPISSLAAKRLRQLSTAATRSTSCIRHRRRSCRSPFRCTPSYGRLQSLSQPARLTAPFTQGSLCSAQKSLILLAFLPSPIRTIVSNKREDTHRVSSLLFRASRGKGLERAAPVRALVQKLRASEQFLACGRVHWQLTVIRRIVGSCQLWVVTILCGSAADGFFLYKEAYIDGEKYSFFSPRHY